MCNRRKGARETDLPSCGLYGPPDGGLGEGSFERAGAGLHFWCTRSRYERVSGRGVVHLAGLCADGDGWYTGWVRAQALKHGYQDKLPAI